MTSSDGDRDSQWESIESSFFAQGAEEDRAAIEQHEAMAHPHSALDVPALRRGILVLAGCAAGVLAVTVVMIRLAHGPAQAATSVPHAGAPVTETPGSDNHLLMPTLPSGRTENQVPSLAGAPAREPAMPKAEPVMVQTDPAVARLQAKEILLPLTNERVSQCRIGLQKQLTTQISGTCAAALELDASLAKPILAWAMSEFRHGRTSVVATWVHKIIQSDPTLADAYLLLGVAEQDSAHSARARQAYKRYLELAPRGAYASDVRSALGSM